MEVDDFELFVLFLLFVLLLELLAEVDFLVVDLRRSVVELRRLLVLDVERVDREGAACARARVLEDCDEFVDGTTRLLVVRLSVVVRGARDADVAPYSGNRASSCWRGANRDFVLPYSARCPGAFPLEYRLAVVARLRRYFPRSRVGLAVVAGAWRYLSSVVVTVRLDATASAGARRAFLAEPLPRS